MLLLVEATGWVGVEEKRQLAELLLQSLDGANKKCACAKGDNSR